MIINVLYCIYKKIKGNKMGKKEKTKSLFIRIPLSWADKITKIAQSEFRTEASVIRQAIKSFLNGKK